MTDIRVKIFTSTSEESLEAMINSFLKKDNIGKDAKITYQMAGVEPILFYSAMIRYIDLDLEL